jgi:hypothetical protein
MGGFPDSLSFGIADAIDSAVRFLADNLGWLFDAIVKVLSAMLNAAEWVLFFIPWWAILLLIAVGGYLATKKIVPSIIYGAMFFVIGLFGYWELMVYTLSIVLVAVLLSLLVGLPYGILMSEKRAGAQIFHYGAGRNADHAQLGLPDSRGVVLRPRAGPCGAGHDDLCVASGRAADLSRDPGGRP